jgi:S-adenosyl-L-methionine hydrolase (adenosine-forming)
MKMKIVTLLTDFTDADGYPAVMKGVILSIAPDIHIIDLSHSIPPQNVLQAALLLGRCAPFFPNGTVHVCVVDPGVGTQRRGIIAQLGGMFYVGPDNGLMTMLYRKVLDENEPIRIFSLDNPAYMLDPVSSTFHGRDIFAPAASYFLKGTPLESFGGQVADPILLNIPKAQKTEKGWEGEVLYIDAFGNLATNIRVEHLAKEEKTHIIIAGQTVSGLLNTFGEGKQGDLVAIIDSSGYVSVCVVNGSAKQVLGAQVGDRALVLFS